MTNIRKMSRSDLVQVNSLLSVAFSDRRKNEGYVKTFIPPCKIEFIGMYLSACPDGSFVVEQKGRIIAAAICHVEGKTGWIGPIVVAPRNQSSGIGCQITRCCIDYLKTRNCLTIGVETMTGSNDLLGFYGKLGFAVDGVTMEMARQVQNKFYNPLVLKYQVYSFNQATPDHQSWFLTQAQSLCQRLIGATDYSDLIQQIHRARYGDSFLFVENNQTIGMAITHFEPPVINERRTILRIITFLVAPQVPEQYITEFIKDLEQVATDEYLNYLHFRVPSRCNRAFHLLLQNKFNVVHSYLRMTLDGFPQHTDPNNFYLNSWV